MNQVPYITITEKLWQKAVDSLPFGNRPQIAIANKAIEIALAEQSQDQYIKADEARKLGEGNAEFQKSNGEWVRCGKWCVYNPTHDDGSVWKYRAIKQPEPRCQVRNEDTGELKTMTREAAKLLQAETKGVCDWFDDGATVPDAEGFEFIGTGIYTYKQKANLVKLNGEFMTREAAIAEWESKKDTCDCYKREETSSQSYACDYPVFFTWENNKFEYQLRPKPLKQIEWKDVPVGVAVRDKTTGVIWFYQGSEDTHAVLTNTPDNQFGSRWADLSDLELAPSNQQSWIAVQDNQTGELIKHDLGTAGLIVELDFARAKYRITGIAKGRELK